MELDALANLTEIFIGLAGFSGITFALKANPKPYYVFRAAFIVCLSFVSIVVALIPTPLIEIGFEEQTAWRVGSGILAASLLLAFPISAHYRRTAGSDELVGWIYLSIILIAFLNGIAQLANVAGLFGDNTFSVLFLGLIGTIVHCGLLFTVLITVGRLERDPLSTPP